MKFRTILGLLIVLIGCSCARQTSIGGLPTDSGLLIENDKNRGVGYTDSLGTKYNLRYIPIIITNDSIIPIHLQIAFSKEYDYPIAYGGEKFKVFAFPKELTPDTATLWNNITDGLGDFLNTCLDNPYLLNKTLEPGEKHVVTIGTLYSRPTSCGVVPNALFAQNDSDNFQACDSLIDLDESTDPSLVLGLKLDFYVTRGRSPFERFLIPCGQISYPER